jgi:LysM repeat protein
MSAFDTDTGPISTNQTSGKQYRVRPGEDKGVSGDFHDYKGGGSVFVAGNSGTTEVTPDLPTNMGGTGPVVLAAPAPAPAPASAPAPTDNGGGGLLVQDNGSLSAASANTGSPTGSTGASSGNTGSTTEITPDLPSNLPGGTGPITLVSPGTPTTGNTGGDGMVTPDLPTNLGSTGSTGASSGNTGSTTEITPDLPSNLPGGTGPITLVSGSTTSATGATTGSADGSAKATEYTVKPGDTLSGIAAKTGVPLARLEALNAAQIPNPNFITPGETIKLDGQVSGGGSSSGSSSNQSSNAVEVAIKHDTGASSTSSSSSSNNQAGGSLLSIANQSILGGTNNTSKDSGTKEFGVPEKIWEAMTPQQQEYKNRHPNSPVTIHDGAVTARAAGVGTAEAFNTMSGFPTTSTYPPSGDAKNEVASNKSSGWPPAEVASDPANNVMAVSPHQQTNPLESKDNNSKSSEA